MEQQIQDLVKEAAREAVKVFYMEQEKDKRKRVFQNTELLMKNYKAIKNNVDNSISEISQLKVDYLEEQWNEDHLFIMSIRKSKLRSLIMTAHIEAALEQLKLDQIKNNTSEKYDVFVYNLIEGETLEKTAEEFGCAAITVRRWKNEMIDRLSVYLFGIEGISLQ